METVISEGAILKEIQDNVQVLFSLWEKISFVFNALKTSDNKNSQRGLFDSLAKKTNMKLRSMIKDNILSRSNEKSQP